MRSEYWRRGWSIEPDIFSSEELARARAGAERHFAGHHDADLPAEVRPLLQDVATGTNTELRVFTHIAHINRDIRSLLDNSRLGSTASRLSGHEELRLFSSALIYKPPGEHSAKGIGWHTDSAYFKTCSCDDMITAWIPLQDTEPTMGGPVVLEGSHRGGIASSAAGRRLSFLQEDAVATPAVIDGPIVEPTIRRGEVLFIHSRLFHMTRRNERDVPRWAVVFFFQSGGNRYRVAHEEDGSRTIHVNDRLCRKGPDGLPDYTDPRICPRVWPLEQR